MSYKLTMHLIPIPAWAKDPLHLLRADAYTAIRHQVKERASGACEICGQAGNLTVDAQWQLDDRLLICTLTGFVAICYGCFYIRHFPLAMSAYKRHAIDLEHIIQHFMFVNSCARAAFEEHENHAYSALHSRLHRGRWKIDLGEYSKIGVPDGSHN